MKSTTRIGALLAIVLAPITATAQTDTVKTWRFDVSLYFVAAGMSGDVGVQGIPANVDVSFGDLLENLQAGFMGRAIVAYGPRWRLFTDVIYMRLGAAKGTVSADVDEWVVQPQFEYHVSPWADAFAGVRYNSVNMDVEGVGPLGNQRASSGTQDWWDPIIGGKASWLFAKEFSIDMRADIGGFGVGSDFTWQVEPLVNWHFTGWGSAQAGYRVLSVDYDTSSGSSEFVYDMLIQGPQVGLTAHF